MATKRKSQVIKSTKVNIHGDVWTVEIITDGLYKRRHGDDSRGIMQGHLKRINIPASNDNTEDLAHEISHAFLYYQTKDDLKLSNEEWEEWYCTFIGKYVEDIYNVLKELNAI